MTASERVELARHPDRPRCSEYIETIIDDFIPLAGDRRAGEDKSVVSRIKNCRFRKQVVPGDVLTLRCELVNRRGPVGYGRVTAMVGDEIAATGELSFAVTD